MKKPAKAGVYGEGNQTYTAWGERSQANLVVEGLRLPIFNPNEKVDNCNIDWTARTLWYIIYADNYDEAMTLYHKLQGWEPYKPMLI